jgi:ABC-type glutathione transport system ATPase component
MSTKAAETGPLITVQGLSLQYRKTSLFSGSVSEVRPLENINLVVRRHVTLAIVGESGAGKSSLARCLAILERPSAGKILFDGQSLLELSRKELFPFRRAIQLVFQDPTSSLNPRLTAAELISEPLVVQREGTTAFRDQRALELMEQVGLRKSWSGKRPLEFSGGERQRLAIARALTLRPSVLIFDEALSSLDIENQESILRLLADLQAEQSLTYIHVSHDLQLLCDIADEIAVMHEGHIVEHKTAAALLEDQDDAYARELFAGRSSVESILMNRLAKTAP